MFDYCVRSKISDMLVEWEKETCCCLLIRSSVLASGSSYFQHSAPLCVCFLINAVSFWLSVSYKWPLWSHCGSVPERCSRRGSSSQHRAHHLAERTSHLSQMTIRYLDSLPLVIFAKSPSSQSGQVKTLTCRAGLLSTWLFQLLCLWPLVAPQAMMKRSPLQLSSQMAMIAFRGDRKFSCVLEWSAVTRLRGKHAQKWQCNGESLFFQEVTCWDTHLSSLEKNKVITNLSFFKQWNCV